MATRRYRRTASEWVDDIIAAKTAFETGLVRRSLKQVPKHLKIIDVVNDIVRRGFKALINERQVIIILDRHLVIYD
jgi:hypothetical protein